MLRVEQRKLGSQADVFGSGDPVLRNDKSRLNTEIPRALPGAARLFERIRVDRMVSIAMPANITSTRIMEKLGLKFDHEFESEGMHPVQYAMHGVQYASQVSTRLGR
jgi:hypothetical protein